MKVAFFFNFGKTYSILLTGDILAKELDHTVSRMVMEQIARLLAEDMRGEFS